MKKSSNYLLLTVLFVLIVTTIRAQEKCKFYKDEIDPISGMQHRTIGVALELYVPMVHIGHWTLGLEKTGNNFNLSSDFVFGKRAEENISVGDSLIIKLDNGKLIKCYANIASPKQSGYIDSKAVTVYKSFYPISVEDLQQLSSTKAVFIRMYLGPMHYDKELKEKIAVSLQKSANCILSSN